MKKIRDILFFHTNYGKSYDVENGFSGRIVVEEDAHTFKGLATDYNHTGTYFIFGKMTKGGLEMIQSSKEDEELPKLYRVRREGTYRYYGERLAKNAFAEETLGECKVVITDPDLYRDWNLEGEIIGLEESIAKFNKSIGADTKVLLEEMIPTKKEGKVYSKKNAQN